MALMSESTKLHVAMIVFSLATAGFNVIMRATLNMGVSKFVFLVYRNIISLLLLAPLAYFVEKKNRPKLSFSFLILFFLCGFIGMTLNQVLFLVGLENVSPTFISASGNVVPAMTFILAVLFSLEQVQLNRKDSIAKILGTVTSLAGALAITLYKGPTIYSPNSASNKSHLLPGDGKTKNWTLGCISSFCYCLSWSAWIVLQAFVLNKYPARLSLYSFTCFFGMLQLLAIAGYVERDSECWRLHSVGELLSVLYGGLVVSGLAFGIQVWIIEKGGPVFFSGYLPLQTMIVAVMASLALGEEFYLGGIIGAVLIIVGLYLVIWGKSKERKLEAAKVMVSSPAEDNESGFPGRSCQAQPSLPGSGC